MFHSNLAASTNSMSIVRHPFDRWKFAQAYWKICNSVFYRLVSAYQNKVVLCHEYESELVKNFGDASFASFIKMVLSEYSRLCRLGTMIDLQ